MAGDTKRLGARAVLDFWLGPRDPIKLDTFRLAFGLSLALYMGAWWQHAEEWLTPQGFHVSAAAAGVYRPVAPLLTLAVLPLFGVLLFGALGAFVLGIRPALSTPLCLMLVAYVTFADPITAFTLNRLYIAGLAIMSVAGGGAYFRLRGPAPRPVSVWPVRVLQATVIIQYFTAGWCKVVWGDWLESPYVLWSQSQGWYMTDLASWLLRHVPSGAFSWMQYSALSFELLAPILFVWRRLRPFGLAWGIVFQVGTALIAYQLAYFSLQMLSFYVLFLDDTTLHRVRLALRRPMAPLLRG